MHQYVNVSTKNYKKNVNHINCIVTKRPFHFHRMRCMHTYVLDSFPDMALCIKPW